MSAAEQETDVGEGSSESAGAPTTKISKSNFILSQSPKVAASEIVAMGAKVGLKFSVSYVHTIRSKARHASKSTERTTAPRRGKLRVDSGETETASNTEPESSSAPTKQAFVARFPLDTPVKEIVEAAKKQGIPLSSSYVYNLRRAGSPKAEPVTDARAGRRSAKAPSTVSEYSASEAASRLTAAPFRPLSPGEERFIDAALMLGIVRAQELLAELPKRLKGSFDH